MPKMKTHSSAKKRFKVTGTGKVLHYHANTSHRLTSRTKKTNLRNHRYTVVDGAEEARVKRMLCI